MNKSSTILRGVITVFTMLIGIGIMHGATQTTVASWIFSEGWDETANGNTITYTPDGSGWKELPNVYWSIKQPIFLPNTFSGVQSDYQLGLKTDGKWQVKQSSTSYVLRLNTNSYDKFTPKSEYGDASKHNQYFQIKFPTTNLNNVKVN